MAEIKIRNIDSHIVKKLNDKSKEKGCSREEFLREELEKIAFKNEIDDNENEYKELCNNLIEAIKLNIKMLGVFMDEHIIDGKDAYDLFINYNHKKSILENKLSYIDHRAVDESDTKDLLVRGLPTYVLDRIDEIARSRKIKRNEFLNIYLRKLTYSNSLQLVDETYKYMLEKSLSILDYNNRLFEIFYDENDNE